LTEDKKQKEDFDAFKLGFKDFRGKWGVEANLLGVNKSKTKIYKRN
jgi:hypothetical protein